MKSGATEISSGQTYDLTDHTTFTVQLKQNVTSSCSMTINFTASDENGAEIATDSSKFVYTADTSFDTPDTDYSFSNDEASGPKHRKIALNGLPLPDEKPQHAEESDQEREETFIDALTGGLRHSTTDVYIPVAGSDFAISARRDVCSEVWSLRNGLRPHEQPDRPFGLCWTSNLAPNVRVETSNDPNKTQPDKAYVTDESGAVHTFIVWYQDGQSKFFPMPTAKSEQSASLETLVGSNGSYIFTRKYGVTLHYESAALSLGVSEDRVQGSNYSITSKYSHLVTATDRLGHIMRYNFLDGASLVPATITVDGRPGVVLSIAQDATGCVTAIWDANGNKTSFNYGAASDGKGMARELLNVVAPDGATTAYGYDIATEQDQTPHAADDPGNTFYHADVNSITDPRGHRHSFAYEFDLSKHSYMADPKIFTGPFIQTGLPRNVTTVTLPNLAQSTFTNQSDEEVTPGAGNQASFSGQRQLMVSDATGFQRTYTFTNADVVTLPALKRLYRATHFTDAKMVFFQTLTIDCGPYGQESFDFNPDAGMAVSRATDLSGNTTTYDYTDAWASADYSQVTGGQSINGYYDDPTAQTDAIGHKIFTYTTDSRIMNSVTDEEGRVTVYAVDGLGRRAKESIFAPASNAAVQITDFEYADPAFPGFMTRKTIEKGSSDPAWAEALVTQYVPDENGRVAQEIVEPDGLSLATSYDYDSNGNKLSTTDPRGNTTWFSYDSRNRLSTVTYADGSQKQLVYDASGNKVAEYDENGIATLFVYDDLNRLVTQARDMNGNGVVDPGVDLLTSYTYNNVNSKLTVTDPNGGVTKMDYNTLQQLKQTTDAAGNVTGFLYGRNSGGNIFDSSSFKPTTITDPRGYVTQVTYDVLYRPVAKSVQYMKAPYPDAFAITTGSFDNVGNLRFETDALGNTTEHRYDALNRPYLAIHADTTSTQSVYTSTGLKWKVIDENTHATQTQYDGAARPVLVQGAPVDDGHGNQASPVTTTSYDGAGNVVATINPLGQEWDYGNDARNRKVQEFEPPVVDAQSGVSSRPTRQWQYDSAGRLIATIDARGSETDTVYDAANRVTDMNAPLVPLPGGGAARPNTHSTFDKNGNALTVTDANSHVTVNTYDAMNRLWTTTDAATIKVTNGYDSAGNRTSVMDGKSQTTAFAYDGLNRNTKITDARGNVTIFAYDGLNKTSRTDALTHVTTYGYDSRNRLTGVSYAQRARDNRTYHYDFAGNLKSVVEPGLNGIADVGYAYDALNRVTGETSGGLTHQYKYDLAGNRTQVTYGGTGRTVSSSYDALNRLASMSESGRSTLYGYDLNGNVVSKALPNGATDGMTYDALNRRTLMTTKVPCRTPVGDRPCL